MIKQRLMIALLVIPICVSSLLITAAERSHRASASVVSDPSCTSSLPCIEYDNNGTGPAIRGVALTSNGLAGWTKFNSTSASNGTAGLVGADKSTSGTFDAGVRGISARGIGVAGQSTSGVGMEGSSSNSVGVLGTSNISDAVRGIVGSGRSASFHAGVAGLDSSTSGTSNEGVYGQTTLGIGVQAVSLGGGTGLAASSASGVGVEASSPNGISIYGIRGTGTQTIFTFTGAVVGLDKSTSGGLGVLGIAQQGIAIEGVEGGSETVLALQDYGTGKLIEAVTGASTVMSLDNAGNMHAHSFNADLVATTGKKLITYAPQASEPTIEDFGEAQLANGSAFVRLESRFASTMAPGANYLVFITPEGDNRGLYVTQKSAVGFAVRESQGGHSTLGFSYRIVAKPFGSASPRLPNYMPRSEPRPVRILR